MTVPLDECKGCRVARGSGKAAMVPLLAPINGMGIQWKLGNTAQALAQCLRHINHTTKSIPSER